MNEVKARCEEEMSKAQKLESNLRQVCNTKYFTLLCIGFVMGI